MRSAYYVAVVTNTYRMALDSYQSGKYHYDSAWARELDSVSHRPYHTGYYFDSPRENANVTDAAGSLGERSYLARVISYDANSGLACLRQQNKFSVGEAVELLMPGKVGIPLTVENLYGADGQPITSVPHPQMEFFMKIPFAVTEGDILRAARERNLS